MKKYALFLNGKKISKWYPTRDQAVAQAHEEGRVAEGRGKKWLLCDVKEKQNEDSTE